MVAALRTIESASAARLASLDRLATNARRGQWSAEEAIDWSLGPRLPIWMTREKARGAISQLYHGEIATSRLCRELLDEVEAGPAHDCLRFQIGDETRHAAVYERYLARLGGVAAMNQSLARALETARTGPFGAVGAILAFHLVLESELLRVHGSLAQLLPCPLLKQINRLVARDEARHVAFGRLFLADIVADFSDEARRSLHAWIYELWRETTAGALATTKRGGMAQRALRQWLQGGWRHHETTLRQIGLTRGLQEAGAP